MKPLPILLLILTLLVTINRVDSALLQTLRCEISADNREVIVESQLGVSIVYTNAQNVPTSATVSCGNGLDVNASCEYNYNNQSGKCNAFCNYAKGGPYQINGRVATGDCGSVKIEALEVNEQNFEDNAYFEFLLLDFKNAQVNLLKINSVPAIVKSDKRHVVNFTTRARVEVANVKCNASNNAKNACTCEVIESEKTRSQVSCIFNQPLASEYKVKFETSDKKEKTFTVILNAGQAAVVYAPQSELDLTVISAIVIAILLLVIGVFYAFRKLEAQVNVKSELNAQRVKILSEVENLKKSNSRGETTDEELELMLTQKNVELEEVEKQIKIEEEKLNDATSV